MDKNIFYNAPFDGNGKEGRGPGESLNKGIDLNEQLVTNKPATFFLRVNSEAMAGAGIRKGDVVIVDRSLEPRNGKIVIAVADGEMLIRRLEVTGGRKRLVAPGSGLSSLELADGYITCWGVVTYVIHHV
jgi:DNA polymerase V